MHSVRFGFVPLLDAAPIIAAFELGFYKDEGIDAQLERQIGWANVRDKLVYGHLDISSTLLGMPPLSRIERDTFPEPLVSLMNLGAGGNNITLAKSLFDSSVGIDMSSPWSAALSIYRQVQVRGLSRPLRLAHVFNCSMHHYLLRNWLSSGGINPDTDVKLSTLPPQQMARQLEMNCLDGFCAGEPWGTLAEQQDCGKIAVVSTELLPDHPEKILAVSDRWLKLNQSVVQGLVRGTLRGCGYVSDPSNTAELSSILSKPQYLSIPAELVSRSLTASDWFLRSCRKLTEPVRSFSPKSTFPSLTHAAWLLSQMKRWKHIPATTDELLIARESTNSEPYRHAAASLGIECPADDMPPMRLTEGWARAEHFLSPSAAKLQTVAAGQAL